VPAEVSEPLRKVRWFVWKFCVLRAVSSEYDHDIIKDCLQIVMDIEVLHKELAIEDRDGSVEIKNALGMIQSVRTSITAGNFTFGALQGFHSTEAHFSTEGPQYGPCTTLWAPLKTFFTEHRGDIEVALKGALAEKMKEYTLTLEGRRRLLLLRREIHRLQRLGVQDCLSQAGILLSERHQPIFQILVGSVAIVTISVD
jgi:hypothetical protein